MSGTKTTNAEIRQIRRDLDRLIRRGVGGPGSVTPGEPGQEFALTPAATSHTVVHNFGRYPSVSVFDTDGNSVEPDIDHVSTDVLTIISTVAFAGTARLT